MIVAILCRIDVGERHRGIRRFAVVIANYIAGDLVDPMPPDDPCHEAF